MNQNKSQMMEELWEFFLAFSTTLEDAKITFNVQERYLMQRRTFNEVTDIYKWVFKDFMRATQAAHQFHKFPLDVRKNMRVLESQEYVKYINNLKEVRRLWQNRPWKN